MIPFPEGQRPAYIHQAVAIRATVRRYAPWAALAAAVMLYVGVYTGLGADPPESWETRLRLGSWGVWYTLQIGGGLMVLSAGFLLTGLRSALLFDAVSSACIGLSLIVSGALMLLGVPMQPLLLMAFGAIFIHSGHRGWQVYRSLATPAVPETGSEAPIRAPEPVLSAPDPPTVSPPEDVDAGRGAQVAEEPEEGYLAAFAKEPEGPEPRP